METTSVAWAQQAASVQKSSGRRNVWLLAASAVAISTLSLVYFYLRGEILLYGDAVAHINIARRVFDSRTPGFLQLGTVWLPLPHILTMPLIMNQWLWQSGVGGSIVSMIAYLFAGLGIARLFWNRLLNEEQPSGQRAGGWIAALVLLLNPNLIYMQATAMTESLSIALTLWAIVWFAEFLAASKKAGVLNATDEDHKRALQRTKRSLLFCAITLMAAMLTRYDAWFLGVAVGIAVLASWFFLYPWLRKKLKFAILFFVMLTAAVPLFWFAYNFRVYKNPLEFANGPYSARAIEKRTARPGVLPHPGYHDIKTAVIYYWKDARLNLGEGKLLQPALVLLALVGVLILLNGKHFWILAFLWLPLLFYSLSIAYGGVPIFMPVWNPFSYYNVRYGLQLLPAIAMALGAVGSLINHRITRRYVRYAANAAVVLLVLACYVQTWRSAPICLREARVNAVTRMDFESKLAAELSKLPPQASLLMYNGTHVGALQQAGISLRRTLNEGNYGMWQAALADPARWVDYVVAQRDDAVWQSAQEHLSQLEPVADIAVSGQPEAILYRVKNDQIKVDSH
ncbi:MAG TPA: hypothetical protein VK738_02810 [Terriglobales bacterium]|nr:hypothetical protein [Terriglobales bacterium]